MTSPLLGELTEFQIDCCAKYLLYQAKRWHHILTLATIHNMIDSGQVKI